MISVIIPAYNAETTIKDAIDSILCQTFTDFEIIVINDGSTDKTEEICRSYGDKIRYIRIEHSGVSYARNIGIIASYGEYIAYQDADDISLSQRLMKELNAMIYLNADMVYTATYISFIEKVYTPYTFNKLLWRNYICCGSVMHKKKLLDDVGMWNDNIDWDLWIRIGEKYNIVGISEPLYQYRHNPEGISTKRGKIKNKRIDLNMYLDAYHRHSSIKLAALYLKTYIEYIWMCRTYD